MIKNLLARTLMIVGVFATSLSFAQTTHTIVVGPGFTNTYSPANVTCTVGDTIKFVWESGFHPTQSLNGTTIPLVNMDGTGGINSIYKIAMLSAGSVPYECTAHGGMGGTITVNAPVSNTPILTENFNFTLNDTLSQIVGSGWTPIATVSNINKIPVTAGLTYATSSASGIGNAALIKNTGQDAGKAFTGTNVRSGSVYTSFLINVSAAQATGDYFFALFDSAMNGTNYRARTFIKSSGSGYRIGVSKSGAVGVAGFNGTDLTFGTTYQIVVKYSIISGTANDSVKLFVNPVLGSPEPTATSVAVTTENDITISGTVGLGAVALRQGTNTNAPTLTIDGIIAGRTWASVTPLAVVNPSVKFNPASLNVNESAGTATVTVNVTNPNATATSVDVKIKGGTAAAGSDYTFTTQTVTFPANSTTAQTFNIPIIDDASQETDETIELVLRNTTNSATIEADSILTITIPANDIVNPVVNFVAPSSVNVAEGGNHIFSVAITNPNSNATNVKVFVKSTSTASSTDYAGITGTGISLTFPGSSSSNQSENVNIVNDTDAENAETVVLVLRDATNSATIGNDSIITITIPQNDQPLVAHFMAASANVNENAGNATVTIMAMGATTTAPTSFDVVYKSGSATQGSDFNYTSTTVTVAAAEDSNVVINIPILDDTIFESDETVVVAIRNITNNGVIGTDSVFTLTIKSDDIKFRNISDLRVNDVNGVSILKDTAVYVKGIVYGVDMQGSPTSLQYTLIDPTGGVGIFRSGAQNPPIISLVPEEGDSVKVYGKVGEFNGLTQVNMDSIVLISKNNALIDPIVVTEMNEQNESYLVRFNNAEILDTLQNTASGMTLLISNGTDSVDLRIDADVSLFNQPITGKFDIVGLGGQFDNSNPKNSGYQLLPRSINDLHPIVIVVPSVSIDSATYNTKEGAGVKSVKVSLGAATTQDVSVTFALTGGSAVFNSDFSFGNPGTLTFAAGETEKTIDFTITDDAVVESNETINFSISDPVNCMLGAITSSSIIIKDNDVSGVNAKNAIEFNAYPNPASTSIKVMANENIETITLVNMIGQTVLTLNNINANAREINVSELSAGVYTLVINTQNGSSSKRVIIK